MIIRILSDYHIYFYFERMVSMFKNPYKFGTDDSRKAIDEEIRKLLVNKVVTKQVENNHDFSSRARLIYDENGLITCEQFPLYQLCYRYFNNGKVESISKCEYGTDRVMSVCTYKYNKDGTIQSIYDDIKTPGRGMFIENTYEDGLCIKKVIKSTKLTLIDIMTLVYDDDRRLVRVFGQKENTTKEWDDNAMTMTSKTVNYDKNGNALHTGKSVVTAYNEAGAVIRQDSDVYTRENTYEENGVLLQKEFSSKLNKTKKCWVNTTTDYNYSYNS